MRRALPHDRTNALAAAAAALEVGAHDATGSAPRSRRTRPSPIASRWSAKLVGCSGTTTRRRRTPTRRCARSRRSIPSCCSRAAATRVSTSRVLAAAAASHARRRRVRRGRARSRDGVRGRRAPVVTGARSMHDAVRRGGRARAHRATSCCSRRRARRSTRTPNYGARGDDFAAEVRAPDRSKEALTAMTVDRTRACRIAAVPIGGTPSRALGRATVRVGATRAAAPAAVRRAVRDGRRAQHRRAGDDPLGVVGRGAQRLRLVVVLLQPPARAGRCSAAIAFVVAASRRLPRAGAAVAPCAARRRDRALLVVVLIPGVGIIVDGSRRWLGVGPLRVQPSEVAKLALLLSAARVLTAPCRRARRLARVAPGAHRRSAASASRDARARPRLDRSCSALIGVVAARRRRACRLKHLVTLIDRGVAARRRCSPSRRRTAGRACSRSCTRGPTRRTPATRSRSR